MPSTKHKKTAVTRRPRAIRDLSTVLTKLEQATVKAGGMRAFARLHGLNHGYLSSVLNGKDKPGEKILAAVGLQKVVIYEAL